MAVLTIPARLPRLAESKTVAKENALIKNDTRTKRAHAWAAVGKKSGKVLRDLDGHYVIYTDWRMAKMDCPKYSEIRRVSIRVLPRARDVRGILKER